MFLKVTEIANGEESPVIVNMDRVWKLHIRSDGIYELWFTSDEWIVVKAFLFEYKVPEANTGATSKEVSEDGA